MGTNVQDAIDSARLKDLTYKFIRDSIEYWDQPCDEGEIKSCPYCNGFVDQHGSWCIWEELRKLWLKYNG